MRGSCFFPVKNVICLRVYFGPDPSTRTPNLTFQISPPPAPLPLFEVRPWKPRRLNFEVCLLNSAHFFLLSFFLAGFLVVCLFVVMIPCFHGFDGDEFGIWMREEGLSQCEADRVGWTLTSRAFHFHGVSFHISSLWVSPKFLFSA